LVLALASFAGGEETRSFLAHGAARATVHHITSADECLATVVDLPVVAVGVSGIANGLAPA